MKLPCRKCADCGVISDISIAECECGEDLTRRPAVLMEVSEISIEDLGEVNEDLEFYVQKCSACGTLNFTLDPEKRVRVCSNCHKARIAQIPPVKYEEPKPEPHKSEGTPCAIQIPGTGTQAHLEEDDEDEDDGAAAAWAGVLGNVQSAMGGKSTGNAAPPAPQPQADADDEDDDDDDDDDDLQGWGDLLGVPETKKPKPAPKPKPKETPAPKPVSKVPVYQAAQSTGISFTSINYGRCSFSLKENEARTPVMLGRYAMCAEFLEQDAQVSGDHCEIFFRGGRWYVRDNHSRNGTFLNGAYIGENGESPLKDGDVLQLGHRRDSIGFTVKLG